MNNEFLDFSEELLTTGDIDPDYIFINEYSQMMNWGYQEKLNWILLKTVVYKSTSELEIILGHGSFETVSYGSERRKAKNKAREYHRNIRSFISMFDSNNPLSYFAQQPEAFKTIQKVKGYGAWAAWKFFDLLDCCLEIHYPFENIDFRQAYTFPLKGLLMVNDLKEDLNQLKDDRLYNDLMIKTTETLKTINPLKVPHNGNRGIRMNEIETLLCKFHSHKHGHYKPGEDLKRLKENIEQSPYDQIAKFVTSW